MRKIVFDIETKNSFAEVGKNDPALLDISFVGVYDSETDEYFGFFENELNNLWPILEKADSLIGYNSEHFDIPLLNKYYPGDLTKIKSVDLMKAVHESLGRRIKLDTIAQATLGEGKSGDGYQAIDWWNAGELEKIKKYCLDDVRITKEIYDYAIKNGFIKYSDNGKTHEVKIDTLDWEKKEDSGITHTLPF